MAAFSYGSWLVEVAFAPGFVASSEEVDLHFSVATTLA